MGDNQDKITLREFVKRLDTKQSFKFEEINIHLSDTIEIEDDNVIIYVNIRCFVDSMENGGKFNLRGNVILSDGKKEDVFGYFDDELEECVWGNATFSYLRFSAKYRDQAKEGINEKGGFLEIARLAIEERWEGCRDSKVIEQGFILSALRDLFNERFPKEKLHDGHDGERFSD